MCTLMQHGSLQEATDPDSPEKASMQSQGDHNPHCPSQAVWLLSIPHNVVTLAPLSLLGYHCLYYVTHTPHPQRPSLAA